MTHEERIAICKICSNRTFDSRYGMICKLTNAKAVFETSCPSYQKDDVEIHKLKQREIEEVEEKKVGDVGLLMKGGILLLASVVVLVVTDGGWFFYGAMVVGMYLMAKGLNGRDLFKSRDY